MKIKRLEICGFKSFVDRTVVHFDHDVTCVVGPNGCGKSNIVDAIRWVMGEQSAKNLRGKAMDDLIFNGSESRGPHGFAEVSLTFDNSDGLAPPEYRDYAEIQVTRRLDRSGDSDYLINKTPVRLMDVTNLFLGTGVGRRAYSIIEQGRIGFIVSAKPEDRRYLIEEAAGITKFKAKKKAAERKMDQTRQNLLRVGDILGEIDKNLASLKRQAQKAERYKEYRAEIRDLELLVASHRWLELSAKQKVIGSELGAASLGAEQARASLLARETELETERLGVEEASIQVDAVQAKAYELDNTVRLLESQIVSDEERLKDLGEAALLAEREIAELEGRRTALGVERDQLAANLLELEEIASSEASTLERESVELDHRREHEAALLGTVNSARQRRSDADTRIARAEAILSSFEKRRQDAALRLTRLHEERASIEERLGMLDGETSELRARLDGLRASHEQTAEQRAELEERLVRLRAEIQESDRALDRLRGELSERRSRLRSLEEIQARFEGVGAGVRGLMTKVAPTDDAKASAGIVGMVADRLECPNDLTQALAAALGDKLQYVVVSDVDAGVAALTNLRQHGLGRATLIPKAPRWASNGSSIELSDASVVGRLSDLVTYAPEDESLARHLLNDVFVVENLDAALAIHKRNERHGLLVTRDGELLGDDGLLTGGGQDDAGAHMLDVKREIRSLYETVRKLDEEMSQAVLRHNDLRAGIAEGQARLETARSAAHEVEISTVKVEKDLRSHEEEQTRLQRRAEQVALEAAELESALSAASDEESEARAEVSSAEQVKAEAEAELEHAEEAHRISTDRVREQSAVVTEIKVRAAAARQRVESDRAALERLARSVAELDSREERLSGDIARGQVQQAELQERVSSAKTRLVESVELAVAAQEELASVRGGYDALREALGRRELELKEIRSQIDSETQRLTALSLEERELSLAVEHLLEHTNERHRLDLRRVIGDYHLRDIPDESVKSRIDDLLRLVERMGEINLTAIEEYEEQSTRHEQLLAQHTDLETAIEQLEKAIRQMNRESRRMFRETFEAVNERFQRIFPKMFGGGKGELRLTNPEDLLETGVDIIAMPPGKRLGSIELMSGGEKALTAVSLIFAIFQHKPSPFCLLDEVDAPLDEANIGRFADSIRQMTGHSQFIVISHSKRTMEMADVLYGVTMETPGISKLVSVELRRQQDKRINSGTEQVAVA